MIPMGTGRARRAVLGLTSISPPGPRLSPQRTRRTQRTAYSRLCRSPGLAVLCVLSALCGEASFARTAEGASAKEILEATGVKGGLIVHVGCGDGRLTAALRANDSYLVHGLDTDPGRVAEARRHILALGEGGKVSVDRPLGDRLPYVDNLVNLVVSEDLGKVSMGEVMRVLCPGGCAYVRKKGEWRKTVKPRPKEIDEWTHYLHDASNNAVAHDSVVGPPRRLQWVGSPRWSRHHDHMSSVSAVVSAGGRVFTIFDEAPRASILIPPQWKLIARDAFNGTILWKRPIDTWQTHMWRLKSGPAQIPRRLVAVGETVFVTLGLDAPLECLDGATGKTIRAYEGSMATEEVIASGGVLFVLVRPAGQEAETERPASGNLRGHVMEKPWNARERRLVAFRADTGERLWQAEHTVAPLTLAADSRRVYFHDGAKVMCLDRANGKELWRSEPVPVLKKIPPNVAPTLVVYQDVVIFAGFEKMITHRGGRDTMTALAAETGEKLWTAPHPPSGCMSPEDLLVAGGLVWTAATTVTGDDGVFRGRDPRTGEIKSEFPPDVKTYWFHHRCHRGKATDRYLLMSRTGIEFIDHAEKHWEIHHWVRGACVYGVMPANGLIYAPQHPCACYPEAKLNGFNALAAGPVQVPSEGNRLERGPAYGKGDGGQPAAGGGKDWPTYRHDAARSGYTKTAAPAELKPAWKVKLGGRLSSVVVAEGKLFVASIDTHTVHALDAASGKEAWRYTAGGRVDSPPTIHKGMALFGSADGWVYALSARDGVLAWRFRAAPADRRLVAFEQVESVWPVPGNVLVQNGVAYCVAGRSMFVDGGLRLIRLDPATGRLLSESILDDKDPETGKNLQVRVMTLNMPVALPDILSSDGRHVFMRSQLFDLEGKRLALGPHSGSPTGQGSVQRGEGVHLFSPTGFLDGDYWHRTYWVYGRSFAGGHAGYHAAGKFAPAGRVLAVDETRVYGFARKPQYYRWTTPIEHHLFATDKEAPGVARPAGRAGRRSAAASTIRIENTKMLDPTGKAVAVEAWVKARKPDGVVVARGGPAQGFALVLRGGRPRFVIRSNGKVSAVSAKQKVTGRWVHLAGVLTAEKKLEVYVDGKLAASAAAAELIGGEPIQAMEIGADDEGAVGDYASPFTFTGIIDEVRVYYGTVTAAEIEEHSSAAGARGAKDATLVFRCSFDKGDAADESGSKHHGQVASARSVAGKFGKAMKFAARRGGRSRRGSTRRGGHHVEFHWSRDIPFLVRAMVLAGKTLFIAGPPDMVDEQALSRRVREPDVWAKLAEQSAALQGRKGALLWAVSAADGTKLAEYKLEAPPAWDGMAAAAGRLYLSTVDGKVLCMCGSMLQPHRSQTLRARDARYKRGTRRPSGLVPLGVSRIVPRCESGAASSAGLVTAEGLRASRL